MELIDTHCHLDLEPLVLHLPKMLLEGVAAGVCGYVVPGVEPCGWHGIAQIATEYPQVFPAFGIHPMHASSLDDQVLAELAVWGKRGVAIGETGLDPTCAVPLETQEIAFREQIRLAVSLGLPLLVHCRKAFQRTLQVMRGERADSVGGVMHAFSGSVEMSREFIRLGFAISIAGTVTWPNAMKPLRLAGETPLEHLLLETDAPDMTPQKYRGRFNRPAWLPETALRLADIKGIPLEELAAATTANARRFLRLGSNQA